MSGSMKYWGITCEDKMLQISIFCLWKIDLKGMDTILCGLFDLSLAGGIIRWYN